MSEGSIEIKRVKVTDLLKITRMAYANMIGIDSQFTELVSMPLGRFIGYLIFPFYFGLTGKGYKAVINGKIVGCAYLYLNKHSGYIFNVNVNHAYRRQGIGRQLMNHLESITKSNRRFLLALQVEDNNHPAKNLYRNLGYRAVHPNFLRYDLSSWELRPATESAVAVESLNRNWGRRYFHRFQEIEQKTGDSWAFKALQDYQENQVIHDGDFWRCLLNGEDAGAACLQKNDSRISLTLALKPEFWGHVGQSGLVKQLIAQTSKERSPIDLFMGSSNHHNAAAPIFLGAGFREMVQSRLFMVKKVPSA